MSNTTEQRNNWAPACDLQAGTFRFWTGVAVTIDVRAFEAFSALDFVLETHGYGPKPGQTGSYNCRKITNGVGYSLHAYGIAVDINWLLNPYICGRLKTDMNRVMINQICSIRTNGNQQVWIWGGDWDTRPDTPHDCYDAMHFELAVSPAELAMGIKPWMPYQPDPSRTEEEELMGAKDDIITHLTTYMQQRQLETISTLSNHIDKRIVEQDTRTAAYISAALAKDDDFDEAKVAAAIREGLGDVSSIAVSVPEMTDEEIRRIASAVADEQAKRLED